MAGRRHAIRFTAEDTQRAARFARKKARYAYNRRGVSSSEQVRDHRVGKLGEIAFVRFLQENGKVISGNDDMFTVWTDVYKVDCRDFQAADGRTIDVKTASRSSHRRILVPYG